MLSVPSFLLGIIAVRIWAAGWLLPTYPELGRVFGHQDQSPWPTGLPASQWTPKSVDTAFRIISDSPRANTLLSAAKGTRCSSNGRFCLTLRDTGDVVLIQNTGSGDPPVPVWWTSTGDNRVGTNGHVLRSRATVDGRTVLVVDARLQADSGQWTEVWHSDLLPQCRHGKYPEPHELSDGMRPAELMLADDGRLWIAGNCELYVPPAVKDERRSLAVIVAGLYRTNDVTCNSHVRALGLVEDSEEMDRRDGSSTNSNSNHPSFSNIDIFAYILYEPADELEGRTAESIEADIRSCYGTALRAIEVHAVDEVEDEFPGGPEAAPVPPCGPGKLRRLNNQLKTLDMARRLWWAWTVQTGVVHDTVLRLRPDTNFYFDDTDVDGSDEQALPPQSPPGVAPGPYPPFWTLSELGGNTVVLAHPRAEHYFYCPFSTGGVGVGPSDQLAYGSAAAMNLWLSMHRDFPAIVGLASNSQTGAARDFSGCENLPSGPAAEECGRAAPCSIECMVAWYLEAVGVRSAVEWRWNQGLLRAQTGVDGPG